MRHKEALSLKERGAGTLLQSEFHAQKGSKDFNQSLTKMLIKTDIPLKKVNHSAFRQFFETEFQRKLPDESTLRKNYVSGLSNEKMEEVRESLRQGYIWIQIDETTDVCGRIVTNVMAGLLNESKSVYLLDVHFLEATNCTTVSRALLQTLDLLYPDRADFSKVLLLLSDSAAYMKKMASGMSALLPKAIHVTCLAHGVHRLAEKIRSSFQNVDLLVNNGKKAFLKAASRQRVFRELKPSLPLPPRPVTTRWGTWITAVKYYADHLEDIKEVVAALDEDAASVTALKQILSTAGLKIDIAYITAHCASLVNCLLVLEKQDARLLEQWSAFHSVHECTKDLPQLKDKWPAVISRNSGLSSLMPLMRVLYPGSPDLGISHDDSYMDSLTACEIAAFKFAPLTSVDVERSFSRYKTVLRQNREAFTKENLKAYMLLHCNL